MTISQVVVDYSQPVQSVFEQPTRVGSIQSIFNRAVNIAVDGTMLALLSDELPRMPNGVRLPSDVMEELVRGIRVGMGVWVGDGRLLIPGWDFSLCLPEAPPWGPRPDMEGYRWQRETVAQHMRLIARYLADRPQRGGLAALVGTLLLEPTRVLPVPQVALSRVGFLGEPPAKGRETGVRRATIKAHPSAPHPTRPYGYDGDAPQNLPVKAQAASLLHPTPAPTGHSPRGMQGWEMSLAQMALPNLRLLARAAWEQDMVGVEEATRGLAGLGPGLTPAGDDVLAGFAAVMALLSARISADGTSRGHVAEVIAAVARPRTTMLSGVLLEYAAVGEVAEQLGELLLMLALPAEESEAVLHAADKLLAFGGTSGSDTLLGVLLGLRALEGGL
jgi:hypothetical protein